MSINILGKKYNNKNEIIELDLSSNKLIYFLEIIDDFTHLQKLILSGNKIINLPNNIFNLTDLNILYLERCVF